MSRIIKFRAWDESGEYFLPLEDDGDYFFIDNGNGLELHNKHGRCKNVILLQFTGMKDKNGKEIYEGDVCECKVEGIETHAEYVRAMVHYNSTVGGFGYKVISKSDYKFFGLNSKFLLSAEIIGNIYENKDLL